MPRSRTEARAVSGIFPSLLPNELFYSAAARFQERMQFRSAGAVRAALFGAKDVTTAVDLPGHLQRFLDRLPPDHPYTVSELIRKHTLFPFYAPFVPGDRAPGAFELLRDGESRGVHSLLNVTGSAVAAPQNLRYCPDCIESQRDEFGTAYWHRLHQVPGVVVCPEHEAPLYESKVERRSRIDRYGYRALSETVVSAGTPIEVSDADLKHHVSIAREAEWLLESEPFTVDLLALRSVYRRIARATGWMSSINQVMTQALERAVLDYYGIAFFATAGVRYSRAGSGDTWVSRVFQLPVFVHAPMRHLVIMNFFDLHAPELLQLEKMNGDSDGDAANNIDGNGRSPTMLPVNANDSPCRNPVCSRFDATGVLALAACSGGARQVPVQCPMCRFAYWYDTNCPRVWGLVETGAEWDAELRRLVLETDASQGCIAKSLGVSTNLLVRLAWEKGITRARWVPWKWSVPRRTGERGVSEAKRRQHRSSMAKLVRNHPGVPRVELRAMNPTAYAWLDRNDPEWLESALPKKRPAGGYRSNSWANKDEALVPRIREAVAVLLSADSRPHRVTVKSIADQMGMGVTLQGMLPNIPQSRELIKKSLESATDIALRRIRWAAAQFVSELTLPSTAYVLAKRAGMATVHHAQKVCDLQAEYDRACAAVWNAAEKMGRAPGVFHG